MPRRATAPARRLTIPLLLRTLGSSSRVPPPYWHARVGGAGLVVTPLKGAGGASSGPQLGRRLWELEAGQGGAERREAEAEAAGGNVRELSCRSPSGKPLGLTPSSGAAAAHLVFTWTYSWSVAPALPPPGCGGRGVGGSVETRNSTRVFPWSWPALELGGVAVSWRPAARLARARAPAEFPVSVGSDFLRREEARMFCLRPNPAALPSYPSHEEEEMENAWEPERCHIASPNHSVLSGPPFLPISYPNFPACTTVKLVHL